MTETVKKICWSVLLAILSAAVGIVARGVFQAWGILEPLSTSLGHWLKIHVSPNQTGWSIAAIIAISCYGGALWLMWCQSRVFLRVAKNGRKAGAQDTRETTDLPHGKLDSPTPSMPIHDLFFHIWPDLLNEPMEKR
jgi:hypothetical protein